MKRIILAALVGVLVSGPVSGPSWAKESKVSIGEGFTIYDKGDALFKKKFEYMMGLLGSGMSWANIELKAKGRALIYCPPGNLAITNGQYFKIFRAFAEKNDSVLKETSYSKGFLLLEGLKETFPCKK